MYSKAQNNSYDIFIHKESTFQVLVNKNDIPNANTIFFVDFSGFPNILIDSMLINISPHKSENSQITKPLMINEIPEKFYCLPNGCLVVRSNKIIKYIQPKGKELSIKPQLDSYDFNKSTDNGIYVWGKNYTAKKNELWCFNFDNDSKTKIFSSSKQIANVHGTGKLAIFSIDSIIYLLKNDIALPILVTKEKVNSIVLASGGFFYATNNGAYYFDLNNEISCSFINDGIKELHISGNNLYLNHNNGAISHIGNIQFFEELSYSIATQNNSGQPDALMANIEDALNYWKDNKHEKALTQLNIAKESTNNPQLKNKISGLIKEIEY